MNPKTGFCPGVSSLKAVWAALPEVALPVCQHKGWCVCGLCWARNTGPAECALQGPEPRPGYLFFSLPRRGTVVTGGEGRSELNSFGGDVSFLGFFTIFWLCIPLAINPPYMVSTWDQSGAW